MENIDVHAVYCRVCGIKCKKAVKIFSGKGRGMGLHEKILKCLMLSVKKRDQLPTRVCYTCIDRLDEFSQFNLLARQAQIKLRTLLKVQGIHVKEEKNSELISTWKALLATQERENGKGSLRGRKRKRKSEIRLDASSDSETSDSSADSGSTFIARHAILPSSGPVLHDSFSLPDSSVNYADQGNSSTSNKILANLNERNQERNLSSAAPMASVSDPPKEEISLPDPVESPQIMPVSRDMMMPYQQQASSIDNSFGSTPSNQPILIPPQIPNSLFLFKRNNIPAPTVGMSPLYVVNLAYNSSESVSNVSQVGNITMKTTPSPAEAPLGQSFSSFLPTKSSDSITLPSELNQTASLINEPSPIVGGNSSLHFPPPLYPIDHLPRSQTSCDASIESHLHKSQPIIETSQKSEKDTYGLGQSCANCAGTSSDAVLSDIESSTKENFYEGFQNISYNDKNLPSPNSAIASVHDKQPSCGLNSKFSDISDAEDVESKETAEISSNLPCAGPSSLNTLEKVTQNAPSAGSIPKVTFKVVSQDSLSCDRSSPSHYLTNIKVASNKSKSHFGNSSVLKSTAESKEDTKYEPKSGSPQSSVNLEVSDDVNSIGTSSSEKHLASEKCKKVNKVESPKEDLSLILAEYHKEDCLKIVSDTESDNVILEEVRKDLISEAKNTMRGSSTVVVESEVSEIFAKPTPPGIDGVPRKLFVSSGNKSSSAKKHAEAKVYVPSKIDMQISSETLDGDNVTPMKENLSKKRLRFQHVDTSTTDQSPQNSKLDQKTGKFKCELCSEHNPTFFNHITDAMYHHQQSHRGVCCLFSCSKCSFVTGQLQNLRQHILASCSFDSHTTTKKLVENPVPKIKQEDSQDYEQALLNLKNALRSVSMPRFRRLLTSCKAVLSPDESVKGVNSNSSFSISSPSSSNINKETGGRSDCEPLDLKCYFCYLSFKSKAELQVHSKNCPSPEKEKHLLDSPPAKKLKQVDVFNSSLFTREGSYYSCVQCGKNFPSVFKAKMHATRSKSCRRNDQNTSMRDAESELKIPDFNLPSTFRTEQYKRLKELHSSTSQSVNSKRSSISKDSGLKSDMVFDIPCIKVEKEDSEEEVLDVDSHENSKSYVDIDPIHGDKEKGDNLMKDLGTTSAKDEVKRKAKEKRSGEEKFLHAKASQTKINQSEEKIDFDLGKVKIEKSEDTSRDCAGLSNNLNSDNLNRGLKSGADSKLQQSSLDKKNSTPSKKSSVNSKVDFNLSVVRQYTTPFQILRPADPKEPVVIPKVKPKIPSKKLSVQKSVIFSPSKAGCSVKPDTKSSAESINKLTTSVSKASSAQEVKKIPEVAHSSPKIVNRTFRPILPKPTFIAFVQSGNERNQNSQDENPSVPMQKPHLDAPKEIKSEKSPEKACKASLPPTPPKLSPEKACKASLPPTPPKPSPESLDTSPSKVWLRNAEKYCMNKTQSNDPNRGLVLKVPLIRLTRLRLLNNGEVDVSGIDLGNDKLQQPSSTAATSNKKSLEFASKEANAKDGDEALICKEEPKEEDI